LVLDIAAGVKKLPEPGNVENWCIYRKGDKLDGPILLDELKSQLKSEKISSDVLIWSPKETIWVSVKGLEKL